MASVASYALCQSACSAGWVACYAAAGLVAGTVTAGVGAPAAALACNGACGACMSACSARFLVEGAVETAATGGAMGPVALAGGAAIAGGSCLASFFLCRSSAGAVAGAAGGAAAGAAASIAVVGPAAPWVGVSVGVAVIACTGYLRLQHRRQSKGFPSNIRVRGIAGMCAGKTGIVVGIADLDVFVDLADDGVVCASPGDLQTCVPDVDDMLVALHPQRPRRRDVMKRAAKSLLGKA